MPKMYVMCGKIGSGKSKWASNFARVRGFRYLNIDECYKILNGDERNHSNKFQAWILFYELIHKCLELGQNVVIDTNTPCVSDRQEFLNWFPEFFEHNLVWMDTTDEHCWENNCLRERHVPKEVFEKANKMFTPPTQDEPNGRSSWTNIIKITNQDNSNYEFEVIKGSRVAFLK